MLLKGKIVVITGSSRGIGRACAVESARQGATGLVLHYYGDQETTDEIRTLQHEVSLLGCQSIIVPGDIAVQETSREVISIDSHILKGFIIDSAYFTDRGPKCSSLWTDRF